MHRNGKFEIRKAGRVWEVWMFNGRSWIWQLTVGTWAVGMFLATGQTPYSENIGPYERRVSLAWRP